MKKTIFFMACLIILSSTAFADSLCADSDDGKDYDRKGKVKYGITEEEDRCVLGPKADVRTETSLYLKEYFCESDARHSVIIDCSREGYGQCYQGACVGGKAGGSATNTTGTTTSIPTLPLCGDKKVNQFTEQCDPPGKICYTETFEIGICDNACNCDPKLKASGALLNESEENKTTVPAANITVPAEEPQEEPKTEIPAEEPKEEPEVQAQEPAAEPEPAPAEEKPRGFFSAIWAWIKGIFT